MRNVNLKVITPSKPKLMYLTLDQLQLSAQCQRTLDKTRVARYAQDFWEAALIPIVVNQRTDGQFYIIDGQHRALLAHMACGTDYPIPCWVLVGLTETQEAKLFRYINRNRKNIGGKDLARNGILAGDPDMVWLNSLVRAEGFGLHISSDRKPWNHFGNSNTLFKILKDTDDEEFRQALRFMHQTWFEDKNCCDTEILKGVLVFLRRYSKQRGWNWKRVSKRLSQFTCRHIRDAARTRSHTHGALTGTDVANAMVELHDYKLQNGRLEQKED